jgi:two-component system, sensor histidine kinase and response regulator
VSDASPGYEPRRRDSGDDVGGTGPGTYTASVLDAPMIAALQAFGRQPGRLLADMLGAYLVEAPALLGEIMAATRHGDAAIGRAVHRLKGASSFIGASRVVNACDDLDHARPSDRVGGRAALAAVRREVERATTAARLLLETLP